MVYSKVNNAFRKINMSNINEMFDAFPDYDVFDERNAEIRPARKKRRGKTDGFNYIQYDEKKDFRNNLPDEEYDDFQEAEHSTDYRDGYGVYRVYEERIKNSASIFFFPFTFIWLEVFLRLGCLQPLYSFSMLFVVLFSLSISGVFTALLTFFGEKFNRAVVKIVVALITLFYCFQMVYFNLESCFWWFSKSANADGSIAEFNRVMDVMSDKVGYLLFSFLPLVLFFFFGKYLFPFRRTRFPAKVCLILAAVLLHFSALTLISFDKKTENPKSNYAVYHQLTEKEVVQERFGLYTMVTKEIVESK